MQLASQPVHQRSVHSGPLVLGAAPVNLPAPTADRDQTVSRRFKPSSRTSLNGEQPYPWDRLQPQDVMSRHRGAKHRRRYELLGGISLLSPEYLLSVEHIYIIKLERELPLSDTDTVEGTKLLIFASGFIVLLIAFLLINKIKNKSSQNA